MMDDPDKIIPGSRVRMHFSLSLPDGSEAVSSFDEEPLEFTMGDGTLTEGLELALFGLRAGADQTIRLDGDQAYGPRDEDNIQQIDLTQFPVDIQPEPGLIVAFSTPDGNELPGMVVDVADGQATVDFNHPLSGHEVVFRTQILSVEN